MAIKVLIVVSQPLLRLGLRAAVNQETDIEICGEAETGDEGLRLFKDLNPNVAIVSLRLTDFCAADDLGRYFEINPEARIIVISAKAGDAEISSTLENGAAAFLTDPIDPDEIVNTIRTVAGGSQFTTEGVTETLGGIPAEKLTLTETVVLRMVVGGMSNKEIAFALDVSDNTVKTHVRHIFAKLGVNDRTSATVTAIRRGLVRVDV